MLYDAIYVDVPGSRSREARACSSFGVLLDFLVVALGLAFMRIVVVRIVDLGDAILLL